MADLQAAPTVDATGDAPDDHLSRVGDPPACVARATVEQPNAVG